MKLTVTIPTSLEDVTLEQYLRFKDIPEELELDRYNELLIQIFCNLQGQDIRQMNELSRRAILTRLKSVINAEEHPFVERVKLNGLELGFLPNLDGMTFGEFVDIESYQGNESQWDKMMRVFYRPIVSEQFGKYEVASYSDTLEMDINYKSIPMNAVLGTLVFFCQLGNELLNHMVKSLELEEKKTSHTNQTSPTNGVGTGQYLTSLTEMYLDLDKLQKSLCINA